MLTIGDRVRISGLITKKEYNGRLGIIQEISDGKILLRIISEARQNHEPRLLKIAPDKLLQAPIVCKSGRILRIGAYVEISGMKKNIDYEGKLGIVQEIYDDDKIKLRICSDTGSTSPIIDVEISAFKVDGASIRAGLLRGMQRTSDATHGSDRNYDPSTQRSVEVNESSEISASEMRTSNVTVISHIYGRERREEREIRK